ncbi:hypothetical protein [Streptomyces swartbergensis]|uniref:hypothetical protein n=1 Tax=Streptomyces swartbergensis TaxID=487165 RepID=UPI003800B2E3
MAEVILHPILTNRSVDLALITHTLYEGRDAVRVGSVSAGSDAIADDTRPPRPVATIPAEKRFIESLHLFSKLARCRQRVTVPGQLVDGGLQSGSPWSGACAYDDQVRLLPVLLERLVETITKCAIS